MRWMLTNLYIPVALLSFSIANGSSKADALLLWQGVRDLEKADVKNAMSISVDDSMKAGGVVRRAIFLHPLPQGRATAEWHVTVSRTRGRVFLCAFAGLRDGIRWDDKEHPADGARFYIAINGEEVARVYLKESGWIPLVADVTERVSPGRTVRIALMTDAGPASNANYDWAGFGEPLLVALSSGVQASMVAYPCAGIAIARIKRTDESAKVCVQALDEDGQPIDGVTAVEIATVDGYIPVMFNFSADKRCRGYKVTVDGGELIEVWSGIWTPELEIADVGPVRAVNFANEPLPVRITVRNVGLGALTKMHRAFITVNGKRKLLMNIPPGEQRSVDIKLPAEVKSGLAEITTTVHWGTGEAGRGLSKIVRRRASKKANISIWESLPELPRDAPREVRIAQLKRGYLLLENALVRWVIQPNINGMGALVYARIDGEWELAATVTPLVELIDGDGNLVPVQFEGANVR
ncbi:MAG TPA: hypothetical protein EYP10_00555, partial [Armatimonadetes bacterium]|nr:hypothetical protein [Armatimonadota bacterium]